MSSLFASYKKLTEQISQGVFSIEEHLLLIGRMYETGLVDLTLGVGAVIDIGFISGTTDVVHSDLKITSTSEDVLVEAFHGVTFNAGTAMTVNSLNGSVGVAAQTTFFLNPTVTNLGVSELTKRVIRGVAGQGNRAGYGSSSNSAFKIHESTELHLYRFTNRGAAGVLDFNMRFGEMAPIV